MNINGRSFPFWGDLRVGHADDVHIICGFLRSHQGLCLADPAGRVDSFDIRHKPRLEGRGHRADPVVGQVVQNGLGICHRTLPTDTNHCYLPGASQKGPGQRFVVRRSELRFGNLLQRGVGFVGPFRGVILKDDRQNAPGGTVGGGGRQFLEFHGNCG